MANENSNLDIDIGSELERQFPAMTQPASLLGTRKNGPDIAGAVAVTEQIRLLAANLLALKNEIDDLEKGMVERLNAMRKRLGKL